MAPKRRPRMTAVNAIERGGGVTTTTTRVYGPKNLYKDVLSARVRISALQRTVRALKDVIVFKALNTRPSSAGAAGAASRSATSALPRLTNVTSLEAAKNAESIISLMETALTNLDTRLLNIGTRVKTNLDRINADRSIPLAQRQALQNKILRQARREKLQIKQKFASINQKLAARRAELSRMRAPLA